jgi:8-oxo-dGTP pyrophosphatase MutT (NUDIX family)
VTMPDIPPLPAATVILVRDAKDGLEALLLQRNHQSGFMPGMFLFPGGALDPGDSAADVRDLCCGLNEAQAAQALGTSEGALAYWAAAIRECFEEAGMLLAYDKSGEVVRLKARDVCERYAAYRAELNAGKRAFVEMLRSEALQLAAGRLTYFSHWITPVGAPRRYDTRFFVAEAPAEQDALHDNRETIHHVWMSPGAALDRFRSGEFKMRTPTVKTLEGFAEFTSAASLIRAMQARRNIPAILPRINQRGERLMPGDPGYEATGETGVSSAWKL